jgi:hypothetical protein
LPLNRLGHYCVTRPLKSILTIKSKA